MIEKIKSKTVIEIEDKIKGIVSGYGLVIVDIDVKGGKSKTITVYLYSKDAVDLKKLEEISKVIYPVIEEIPFFKPGFNLEVSTPGIFRNIKYFEEFNIYAGKKIKIISSDGLVHFGINSGLSGEEVRIEDDGNVKSFKVFDIKRAMLNG